MGRTGRKRAGKIILLLTKGKEEDAFRKAKDNYDKMQKMIISGEHFTFRHEVSPRILPRGVVPVVDKQHIIPPVEAPEPQKVRGRKKLPPKKFHMPDGVNNGFIKASRIGKPVALPSEDDDAMPIESDTESLAPNYPDASSTAGLLNEEEEKHLHKYYTQTYGDEEVITIALPRLDVYPEFQRSLSTTKFVGHSRTTKSVVKMLNVMRKYEEDPARVEKLKANFREEDFLAERDSISPPPMEKLQPKATNQEAGWKFGSLTKHKFMPKPKPTAPTRRKRAKTPSPISLPEDEVNSAVIDITSFAEPLRDPSPFTSSALYDEGDIIIGDREGLEVEEGDDEDEKEDGDGGDDDDDELPDASVLMERLSTPKVVKYRSGAVRKKRRVADSDEDEE